MGRVVWGFFILKGAEVHMRRVERGADGLKVRDFEGPRPHIFERKAWPKGP